ncbi:MAG: prephenate dehydratase [Pseudomonadota bacterium]|nr:prephenate dehydratase [Pseudomonadota bacterium]
MKESLEKLRGEIRDIDAELLRLLNERASRSVVIGRIKRETGADIYRPDQEARILAFLKGRNPGPLPHQAVAEIYREILSSSRALQAPLTVAYLGPEGSFSHLAARAHFGHGATLTPVGSIDQVFDRAERDRDTLGVAPVENSTEGSVGHTLRRLIATPLAIRAEIFLPISLCLLTNCPRREEIERVYSHPQALAQCRRWLAENLPRAERIETASTSAAGQQALADPAGAAVGSRLAGEINGLAILAAAIEDIPGNATRFLVLGGGEGERTGRDKTSILFGTPHVPGALHQALAPIARERINLLRIESHPLRERKWEYLFFADLAGHRDDEPVAGCLREMAAATTFIKVLGSYARGEEGS